MSYHIYQTEGFIVGSVPINEASRYISIYTEDLGMVRAVAQGVRNLRSKLKHSLQDLSFSKVSFVRGREVWRIVNSEKLKLLETSLTNKEKREFTAKIASILKRFVRGELIDRELFLELKNGFVFLDNENFSEELLLCFELLFVLRILDRLGYVADKSFGELYLNGAWHIDKIKDFLGRERELISIVNSSMAHSHL